MSTVLFIGRCLVYNNITICDIYKGGDLFAFLRLGLYPYRKKRKEQKWKKTKQ